MFSRSQQKISEIFQRFSTVDLKQKKKSKYSIARSVLLLSMRHCGFGADFTYPYKFALAFIYEYFMCICVYVYIFVLSVCHILPLGSGIIESVVAKFCE